MKLNVVLSKDIPNGKQVIMNNRGPRVTLVTGDGCEQELNIFNTFGKVLVLVKDTSHPNNGLFSDRQLMDCSKNLGEVIVNPLWL